MEPTPIADQPPPVPSERRPTWELVIEDMQERDKIGRVRYGTPLQPFNGRDNIVDAYQEGLDLVVYLRNEIEERRQAPAAKILDDLLTAINAFIWGGGIPWSITTRTCRVCGASEGTVHNPTKECGELFRAFQAASRFAPR